MVKFETVPVEQVLPKRRGQGTSQRAQVRQEYQEALKEAIQSCQALVVDLEPEDKPLTIRNRLKRAGQQLGADDLVIRRRGQRIVAYQAGRDDEQAGGGSPAVLEKEGVAS
jgi:hypothetical protein